MVRWIVSEYAAITEDSVNIGTVGVMRAGLQRQGGRGRVQRGGRRILRGEEK